MKEAELKCLDERMDNWSQWFNSWDGGHSRGSCGSAEGRYVAPRVDEEKVAARNISVLDVADAEEVHAALLMLAWLPERKFLYDWYAHKYPPAMIARMMGLKIRSDVHVFRRRNLELLAIELVRLEKSRVVLIRRGAAIWSGVAKVESSAYKAPIVVASSGPTECRDQPIGWSGAPGTQTEPA